MRRRRSLQILVAVALLLAAAAAWQSRPYSPLPRTEIFRGVYYSCLRLPASSEGSGAVHLVEIDLTAPGIELYVTPLDDTAVREGYQYRLQHGSQVLHAEQLCVLINGTLFSSQSGWWRRAGDLAASNETVVANGIANHTDPHSYLLWFDAHLRATLETTKPPPPRALEQARWGMAGQIVVLNEGHVSRFAGRLPDKRTAMGIDADRSLLWLATFDNASERRVAEVLAAAGARDAIMLDGGGSTSMVLAPSPAIGRRGTLAGGFRPVATFFGVRAHPLISSPGATAKGFRSDSTLQPPGFSKPVGLTYEATR